MFPSKLTSCGISDIQSDDIIFFVYFLATSKVTMEMFRSALRNFNKCSTLSMSFLVRSSVLMNVIFQPVGRQTLSGLMRTSMCHDWRNSASWINHLHRNRPFEGAKPKLFNITTTTLKWLVLHCVVFVVFHLEKTDL